MNINPKFIAQLKGAKAPLNSKFKARLKFNFMQQAEVPQGFAFFNLLNMKSFSLASLSSALVLALVISVFSSPTLNPEDILAQAEAVYESEGSQIMHQKVSIEQDAKGGPTVEEFWYDASGNYYHIWYNKTTKELINGYLYKLESDGTARFYSYIPNEEEIIIILKNGRFEGMSSYDATALSCYQVFENNEDRYRANILSLDQTDLGSSQGIGATQQDFKSQNEDALANLSQFGEQEHSIQETKAIIESLKENTNLQFEEKKEGGKTYFVFKDHVVNKKEDVDFTFVYTFDAESYQLIQKQDFQKDELQTTVNYELEILNSESSDEVYDPSRYGLYENSILKTVELIERPESGCYNDLQEKLSEEETEQILDEIPEELRIEFQTVDLLNPAF